MQTKKYKSHNILFSAVLFALISLILNTGDLKAQINTEAIEKCVELSACVEKFYKDCQDRDFRNSFSPRIFDKFGIVNLEDELARLNSFRLELNSNPEAIGFVVVYGGRINKFGEINARVKRVTNHLFSDLKIDLQRIKVVQGGFREKFEFEFWISRIKGVSPPLLPTINVEKVIFRGRMKPLPTEMGT